MFLLAISAISAMTAVLRLGGGRVWDFSRAPFAARTPADFWRRYNRLVQQFFFEDVFRSSGRRMPIRTAFWAFALSGVLHEYLFTVSIGRVQGYQMLFFLVQGLVAMATFRLKPRGRTAVLWVGATLAFNIVSSVLFVASVDQLVPFYSEGVPGWLAW